MTDTQVTALLFDPPIEGWPGPGGQASIGLVIDDTTAVWGDVLITAAAGSGDGRPEGLSHLLSKLLLGQSLDTLDLRQRLQLLDEAVAHMDHNWRTALQLGVTQALVAALAWTKRIPVAAILADSFVGHTVPSPPHLILEVDNQWTTASVVQHMMELLPDGVGYRLASGDVVRSIGTEAQYLQRFVRELGLLLTRGDYPTANPPIIYLGLAGAIGSLTADPWRELGRVLGHCSGLEQAAGALTLWLEDPLYIEDEVLHTAALAQLRDYMHVRDMRSRLIARSQAKTVDGLHLLCDADAIDGVCLLIDEWGSLTDLFEAVRLLRTADKMVILGYREIRSLSQVSYMIDLGTAASADAILLTMGKGEGIYASEAKWRAGRDARWREYGGL